MRGIVKAVRHNEIFQSSKRKHSSGIRIIFVGRVKFLTKLNAPAALLASSVVPCRLYSPARKLSTTNEVLA